MSDSENSSFAAPALQKTFSDRLKQFIPLAALAIVWLPAMASADSLLMLHNEKENSPVREIAKQAGKRSVTVGLNENGDLTIRHSDLSLIVAYNPTNDIIDYQERIKIAQRQDCPAISGISLKVSLVF